MISEETHLIFTQGNNRMHYEISGSGDSWLLLLHGWGGSTQSLYAAARDFADTKRVINIDFPGFGESPEPDSVWGVGEYADMVLGLLDELKIEQTDVISHSFGGRVTLMMNEKRPGLIRRQVLTGCAGLTDPEQKSGKSLSRVYDNRLTRVVLGDSGVEKLRNFVRSHFGSEDYKNASPRMREIFKVVIAQDLRFCLPCVKASTLLIWGENDTATPLWMGKEMEKSIGDAALIVFENSGHFAYLEQYGRFIAIARQFLNA